MQPRGQGGLAAEGVESLQRTQQCLLDEVVGQGVVARDGAGVPDESRQLARKLVGIRS